MELSIAQINCEITWESNELLKDFEKISKKMADVLIGQE